jgi:hypothetical protein
MHRERLDAEQRRSRTAWLPVTRGSRVWLAAGLVSLGIVASAAPQPAGAEPSAANRPHMALEQLTAELNLTKQQQANAAPILRAHKARLEAIRVRRASGALQGLAGLRAIGDARAQLDRELAKILDPAQRESLRKFRERQRAELAAQRAAAGTASEAR